MTWWRPARSGLVSVLVLAGSAVPADGQGVKFRLLEIDMYGGPVAAVSSELGVVFGTRLGFVTIGSESVRLGASLGWWTARRRRSRLDVRDVVLGLEGWRQLSPAGWLRSYFGIGADLHAVDSTLGESVPSGGGSLQDLAGSDAAASLDGYRLGGSGFAGAAARLSEAGAIWLIVEYRYSAASRISNQQVRAGVRLSLSGL